MMAGALDALTLQIAALAAGLPPGRVHALAEALQSASGRDWAYLRLRALQVTAEPRARSLIDDLLEAWRLHAPEVAPESVALALLSATAAAGRYRKEQSVELVWTGPDVQAIPLRRTDQVLLEVIESARQSLLVVSFAVYRVHPVSQAIVQAAGRGVRVRICVERSEEAHEATYDPLRALGREVVAHSEIYAWPQESRPQDPQGRSGILHAKLAVADEGLLFLSSANLTEYALNLNMEMGVLVRGGQLPGRVASHFQRLIATRVLRRIGWPGE